MDWNGCSSKTGIHTPRLRRFHADGRHPWSGQEFVEAWHQCTQALVISLELQANVLLVDLFELRREGLVGVADRECSIRVRLTAQAAKLYFRAMYFASELPIPGEVRRSTA